MTSASKFTTALLTSYDEHHGSGDRPLRMMLKPDGPATGHVDGGWWPRSLNLEDELPALMEGVRDRLGQAEQVSYHLGDWQDPPRVLAVYDARIRIGGYRLQRAGSVDVISRDRRLTLLVIAPEQTEQSAHSALSTAASAGNTDDLATLLALSSPADEPEAARR